MSRSEPTPEIESVLPELPEKLALPKIPEAMGTSSYVEDDGRRLQGNLIKGTDLDTSLVKNSRSSR